MKKEELEELEYSHKLSIKNMRFHTMLNRVLFSVIALLFLIGTVESIIHIINLDDNFYNHGIVFEIMGIIFLILMLTMIVIFYKTASIFKNLLMEGNKTGKIRANFLIWLIIFLMFLDLAFWILKTISLVKIYSHDIPTYTIKDQEK